MSGDFIATNTEIHCPLCDYDLRGLENPRCPECGYKFEWEELRKSSEVEWKYFERAMRRKVRAYFRTLLLTFWPPKLWRTMKTIDRIVSRRLIVFWSIPFLLIPVLVVLTFVYLWIALDWNGPTTGAFTTRVGATAVWTPFSPPASATGRIWMGIVSLRGVCSPAIVPVLLAIAWPWLTFSSMQVFTQSLIVARIRKVQLLRVILYSDCGILIVLLCLALAVTVLVQADPGTFSFYFYSGAISSSESKFHFVSLFVAAILPLITTWRLVYATRAYLRFRNAATMMILSQIIVALTAWTALLISDDQLFVNWQYYLF